MSDKLDGMKGMHRIAEIWLVRRALSSGLIALTFILAFPRACKSKKFIRTPLWNFCSTKKDSVQLKSNFTCNPSAQARSVRSIW